MIIRSRKCLARGVAAFTLPEVVISLLIIAIGAAALMGCFNFSFFGMKMTRENLRATQVMLEKAEAIRLWRWDKMNATYIPTVFTNYYDETMTNADGSVDVAHAGTEYDGTVSITSVTWDSATPSYNSEMVQVTIGVTWQTGNLSRHRDYVTYVSRYGIQNYVY